LATTYIVLRELQTPEVIGFEMLGTADTDTPRQAIKAFSENGEGKRATVAPGAYVAVPARNWTEEECEVKQEVRYRARNPVPGGGIYEITHVPVPVIPGQTTIEEAELAEIIGDPPAEEPEEGDSDVGFEQEGVSPEEFGPEEEEPFDPANLGGKDAA
jgi:hypothetical protein